jgi:hypothetical protein
MTSNERLLQAIRSGEPVPGNDGQEAEMRRLRFMRNVMWIVVMALIGTVIGMVTRLWPVLWWAAR